ncbi:MAG: hypothetical protein QW292_09500 [Candidatus Parvarchaeota archaeon]
MEEVSIISLRKPSPNTVENASKKTKSIAFPSIMGQAVKKFTS